MHKTAIVLPSCASTPMRQSGSTMFSWHPHGQTQTERLKHELWCYLALLRGCVSTTETKFTVPRFPPKMRSPGPWILSSSSRGQSRWPYTRTYTPSDPFLNRCDKKIWKPIFLRNPFFKMSSCSVGCHLQRVIQTLLPVKYTTQGRAARLRQA